ncbi:XRE family transcriptional regulator [Acuticoccus sp. M5D2P5]|uniref:helix-turn-helix transcriptional regulator n=1 Tax=Acuticoccus kalidii TaxID=2910977 RepID=UPI001F437572|nr:XRE family transcriptional regulator [Acuticoccus kalidii]MCF3933276.1 XRE family transcriptional regulator [Acuticoccus kalidii]
MAARSERIIPSAYRLLRRPQAAAYCGVSVGKFDQLVQDRSMPRGHWIGGCLVWDMKALDENIDALLYGSESSDPALAGADGWDD